MSFRKRKFEVTHLLQQVSRIDLTNRQYDSEVSYEPANYVIKIRTLSSEILLKFLCVFETWFLQLDFDFETYLKSDLTAEIKAPPDLEAL